jgi:hypothetical protein
MLKKEIFVSQKEKKEIYASQKEKKEIFEILIFRYKILSFQIKKIVHVDSNLF